MVGAGKDFITGQQSNRSSVNANSNSNSNSNRPNPLENRREQEASKRASDLQEEQIREIKKLNQQLRNNNSKR